MVVEGDFTSGQVAEAEEQTEPGLPPTAQETVVDESAPDGLKDEAVPTPVPEQRFITPEQLQRLVDRALADYLTAVESGNTENAAKIQAQVAANPDLIHVFENRLRDLKEAERRAVETGKTEVHDDFVRPLQRIFAEMDSNPRYYHALNRRLLDEHRAIVARFDQQMRSTTSLAELLKNVDNMISYYNTSLAPTLRLQYARLVEALSGRPPDNVDQQNRTISSSALKLKDVRDRIFTANTKIRNLAI